MLPEFRFRWPSQGRFSILFSSVYNKYVYTLFNQMLFFALVLLKKYYFLFDFFCSKIANIDYMVRMIFFRVTRKKGTNNREH